MSRRKWKAKKTIDGDRSELEKDMGERERERLSYREKHTRRYNKTNRQIAKN